MSKLRLLDAVKGLDLPTTRKLLAQEPALLSVVDRNGMKLLHLACSASAHDLGLNESAAASMAGFLLDSGSKIDEPVGKDRCTPLFLAVARARNLSLVRFLLKRGADVNRAPGGGLFAAGWWEDLKILDVLIRAGAKIDIVVGMTPFLGCWLWKRFEAAKFLVIRGADVNYREPKKGRTALHTGIEKEFDPALLKWLVQRGASPDIKNTAGVSAREQAARKRDKQWLAALS